jgi:hypothetical protein
MAKERSGKQQAQAALRELRKIEKARLKLGAEDVAIPHFADWSVNAVFLISDLAADALRRAKGTKKRGKIKKANR